MKSIITIAIPFYNAERFLELAIKSVLIQSYTNWKLILMDDGSNDKSLEIARKFENQDSRIKVYSDGLNKNLASRLNEISGLVCTKYLARMDADDIMHPERIKKQLELLEANPKIDVLGTNAYSIDEKNNIQGIRLNYNQEIQQLLNVKVFIHPTVMGRTQWFMNNPYDINMKKAQDYDLWSRTSINSTFKIYTEPLLFYREYGKDYYKKYLNGISSKFYFAYKLNSIKGYLNAFKYLFKAFIFLIFNKFGIEQNLIKNRFYPIKGDGKNKANDILIDIIKYNNI